MFNAIGTFLFACFLMSLLLSVYYSVKSRRQYDANLKGLFQARQNISMGIMLTLLALYQMLFKSGSTVGIVIGVLFLLVGLFNLFAGIRNHAVYRNRIAKDDQ